MGSAPQQEDKVDKYFRHMIEQNFPMRRQTSDASRNSLAAAAAATASASAATSASSSTSATATTSTAATATAPPPLASTTSSSSFPTLWNSESAFLKSVDSFIHKFKTSDTFQFFRSDDSVFKSTDDATLREFLVSKSLVRDNMLSQDWMGHYEDDHQDVNPLTVFSQQSQLSQEEAEIPATESQDSAASAAAASGKLGWAAKLYEQCRTSKLLEQAKRDEPLETIDEETRDTILQLKKSAEVVEALSKTTQSTRKQQPASAGNKRKRSSGRKRDPSEKVYFVPTDHDVLCGRGGRTNHHPGNKVYLHEKEKIQERYLRASKADKTNISQELVDIIHELGGRFLEQDDSGRWFEITPLKARKKASQTLREINTPEERRAKRERYSR